MAVPYTVLSCAMSVDGYLDDASPARLLLSSPEDFDRVDELRAGCDAILIGAGTLRADDPRLLVNSADRRAARVARGEPEYPRKVVLTSSGELDPSWKLWHTGGEKLVYCPGSVADRVRTDLGSAAEVVGVGATVELGRVLEDLGARGVRRLMVEGGSAVLTQFLVAGLADELQLAVAPLFVGQPGAPRFVGPGSFIHDARRRMRLVETRAVGDVALLRYLLGEPLLGEPR